MTQSRSASLVASLRVRVPDSTGMTVAPRSCIRYTLSRWRSHILRPHVHHALEIEAGADGRGRNPVLTGAGLGDDPALPHSAREQGLADRVVDLVGAGVVQVLPLEHYPGTDRLAEAGGFGQG